MMLSDKTISMMVDSGDIMITPEPKPVQFQPVSVDLLLGTSFVRLPRHNMENEHKVITDWTIINPGEFLLASTHERIRLAPHIAGVVCGKSTWARRGLMVEAAGLVDPGFDGTITLELKNLSHLPVRLPAGVPIAQIAFHLVDMAVLRPYGSNGLNSHYQGQLTATSASGVEMRAPRG